MHNDLLLYIGAGLLLGSAVLGVALGLAYILRTDIQEFRYGAFYSVFALVASMGYCLASIAFFFQFLGPKLQIPLFCSLVALGVLAGLAALAILVRKDNRVLFILLSFYCLVMIWLAPVFLWNLIYLVWVPRRSAKDIMAAHAPPPLPTPAGPPPLKPSPARRG